MTIVDAIVEAFRLFVLTVTYVLEESRKAEQRRDDARKRRELFETAVARALTEMRERSTEENQQVDAVDKAADEEKNKPWP